MSADLIRLLMRASNHLGGDPDPTLHADICAALAAHGHDSLENTARLDPPDTDWIWLDAP